MKSLTKLGALVLPLVLITGCASHSHTLADISNIQAVKDHFARVEAHVGQVENTANVALTTARDASSKVDRMFHKAMSK
tara:strand:- start:642 stop:878 length:237 start_codon:yes stop_codon:yes gene_type:complete